MPSATVYCCLRLTELHLRISYACFGATTAVNGVVDWRAVASSVPFSPGYGIRERDA